MLQLPFLLPDTLLPLRVPNWLPLRSPNRTAEWPWSSRDGAHLFIQELQLRFYISSYNNINSYYMLPWLNS